MSSLRDKVASFQIAPKYNICIGGDNADLLIGLILDEVSSNVLGETYDGGTGGVLKVREILDTISEMKQ